MNSPIAEPLTDQTDAKMDTAAQSTGRAIEGAARAAQQALGSLAGSVENVRRRATPALHDLAASARSSADAVRDRALQARDTGADLVRARPMQALMIAAAAGAALVLLGRFLMRGARPGEPR
jgi:ElaB/YqjD/DUF883 family membrane-anchored ribosome-binding protein